METAAGNASNRSEHAIGPVGLLYQVQAQEVFDSLEDIAIAMGAALAWAVVSRPGTSEWQRMLDPTYELLDCAMASLGSMRPPVAWQHDHHHLRAAASRIAAATRGIVSARNAPGTFETEPVAALLKAGVHELKCFERRLPGYHLIAGCGCEVTRGTLAAPHSAGEATGR